MKKTLCFAAVTLAFCGAAQAQTYIKNDDLGASQSLTADIANPRPGVENTLTWGGEADGSNSVSIGGFSSGQNNIVIGGGSFGSNNVAIGQLSSTGLGVNNAVAIGANSSATLDNTVSFGNAYTGLTRTLTNISVGTGATDAVNKSQLDTAIAGVSVGTVDAIARTAAAAAMTTAVGADSKATAAQADATKALTGGAWDKVARTAAAAAMTTAGVALDQSDEALRRLNSGSFYAGSADSPNTSNAVAIGSGATVKTDGGIAIGQNTTAILANSVAIGSGATAKSSVAVGTGAQAMGTNTTALGDYASATGEYAVALGNNTKVTHNNSVALGNGTESIADNTVAVGNAGTERRITGVRAGVAPTDAVNRAQLSAVESGLSKQVRAVADDVAGNRKIAASGVATALAMNSARPANLAPGETAIGIGTGAFDGQAAVSVAISHNLLLARSDVGPEPVFKEIVFQGGVGAAGSGGLGVSAGVSFKF